MRQLVRHAAVFCVMLGVTALIAFFAPLSVNSRHVFFIFIALFFIYLGAATYLDNRQKKPKRRTKA